MSVDSLSSHLNSSSSNYSFPDYISCSFSDTEYFIFSTFCVFKIFVFLTYMSLRKERGIRIRSVAVSCAWLLNALGIGLLYVHQMTEVVILTQEFAAAAIISFCCQSVLCVLIHPGSTIQVRNKVDQSKQRAFYTIIIILAVLMLRLSCGVFWVLLDMIYNEATYWMIILNAWINLPSNFVLPLMFLQRAGKCVCLSKEDKR